MNALVKVIDLALNLYLYVIIGMAVMSWLIAFDVVNIRNDMVRSIWNALNALTEPVLRPIRRILPNLGGVDISPIIVIFIIYFLKHSAPRQFRPGPSRLLRNRAWPAHGADRARALSCICV